MEDEREKDSWFRSAADKLFDIMMISMYAALTTIMISICIIVIVFTLISCIGVVGLLTSGFEDYEQKEE